MILSNGKYVLSKADRIILLKNGNGHRHDKIQKHIDTTYNKIEHTQIDWND